MFLVRIIASMAVNNSTFSLLACYNNQVPTHLCTEGQPGGFCVKRKLLDGLPSPTLRFIQELRG